MTDETTQEPTGEGSASGEDPGAYIHVQVILGDNGDVQTLVDITNVPPVMIAGIATLLETHAQAAMAAQMAMAAKAAQTSGLTLARALPNRATRRGN